jgi:hypothetical protein
VFRLDGAAARALHSDAQLGLLAADTVARLTEIGRNSYESAFRWYTGRWEPLPGSGNLPEVSARRGLACPLSRSK